jgi:conjugal transfer pilus assembly protein TraB
LRQRWEGLEPGRKRTAIISLVLGIILIVSAVGYMTNRSARPERKAEQDTRDIKLEPGILQKSLYQESRKGMKLLDEKYKELEKELKELKRQKEAKEKEQMARGTEGPSAHLPLQPQGRFSVPPPPASSGVAGMEKRPEETAIETIGDIEIATNPNPKKEPKEEKKGKKAVYLPPSFMEANLLSGLDAQTVESARGNPSPVLFRVKDLAVLPNRVKANLKGCFVIAEGYGSLADERAHIRLVSLSCLDRKGQAVIDQKVKGVVIDEDGKLGLRGTVVSKMGSVLARSMLAGFFGGIGDAVQSASTTTSISPIGSTQTVKGEDIAKVAAGKGIAGGAYELQKFYLDLARQSLPVIEVGATKTVTLVITEGVELELKNYCVGGNSECKD